MVAALQLEAARAHFGAADPVLAAATAGLVPIEMSRPRDPYVALLRAIVGQQLSVKAASTIWSRVVHHFDGAPEPHVLLDTDADVLRKLGLSRRKAEYVCHVADEAVAGELHDERLAALDDDALIERLTAIRGVGRWTVEMIMMFGMQRPDVFSAGDLGIQQSMRVIYGVEGKGKTLERAMRVIAEPWSPHRTAACRLLWAWHREHYSATS